MQTTTTTNVKDATLDILKSNFLEGTISPAYEVFLDVPKNAINPLTRPEVGNLFSFNIVDEKLQEAAMAGSRNTIMEVSDDRVLLSVVVNEGYLPIFLQELKRTTDVNIVQNYNPTNQDNEE